MDVTVPIRTSTRLSQPKPGPTRKPKPKPKKVLKDGVAVVVEDIEDFGGDEVVEIRASLLKWYDENKRDLPWRRRRRKEELDGNLNRRAYEVWVSEVMLQQTRVQTVIDYFNRWMEKWPSIQHLAEASIEEVNELWAGLGYYRRARFLLEGAKMIVDGGGEFPKSVEDLRKVRGIGDYTAGAIASIAFEEAVPLVDGNVVRVIARLKAISTSPKEKSAVMAFWRLAGQLVDPQRPGDFNQALMELGATICSPLNPSCNACPISRHCQALSISTCSKSVCVTDYPIKVIKTKQRPEFSAVCVVEIREQKNGEGEFILVRRPEEGLLAGLWEFPSVPVHENIDLPAKRKAVDQFLNKSLNLVIGKTCDEVLREDVGEYVHIFSHIRLKLFVELLVLHVKDGNDFLRRNQDKYIATWKCVNDKALSSMGLTSSVRKVYTMIQKFKKTTQVKTIPVASRKRRSRED
ncbi:unnamed protein product [Rhodiola kirilowii]